MMDLNYKVHYVLHLVVSGAGFAEEEGYKTETCPRFHFKFVITVGALHLSSMKRI
jgi:hypothetical protein